MASREVPEEASVSGATPARASHSSPHDALFKFVFSQAANARAELGAVLPAELVSRLDWASLTPLPASFVDERLKGREADLLFSVRCGDREALLYLLLEHQSTSDDLIPFRLLRYVVRIWDAFLQAHPDARRLPAVIPVVVHHSDSGWSAPTDLSALIDLDDDILEAVSSFVPRFRFVLDDLAVTEDSALQLRSHEAAATAGLLLLARARTSPDLLADLQSWHHVFRSVIAAPNGLSAFAALMTYALEVTDIGPEGLDRFVQQLGPRAQEAHMTGADRLREQGMTQGKIEGRAEGKAEGKAELLLRQLALRFGELSVDVSRRVQTARVDQLDEWAERVLTAPTLSDVLG